MFIVLGATGHVGSAVADALLDAGEAVTVVTRDPAKGAPWRAKGAEVAALDIGDADALRDLFRRAARAFLLNPPADVSGDSDAGERRTAASIAAAVAGSRLEKVVVESVYGARPGERIGDLSVLHGLEEAVRATGTPAAVLRGPYYMSNWAMALHPARERGVAPTLFPPDFALPMAAPEDLGREAAALLRDDRTGIIHAEGPSRYSSRDVADAFAAALGRPVEPEETPRGGWQAAFRAQGFSAAAAESYARMTAATLDGAFPSPDVRGPTTLRAYIAALAEGDRHAAG